MPDYWRMTMEYKQGDTVQRYSPKSWGLSPFVGRVTAVHRGIGMLDVQFPHANERLYPDEIVKVDDEMVPVFAPEFDSSYSSYDITRARSKWASSAAAFWAGSRLPAGFYTTLARSWSAGATEVSAYDEAWHRYAAQGVDDESLRAEVAKFYGFGERLQDLRILQHVTKTAAYWVAQNRQYRVTADEVNLGKPKCPKCATPMRRTTYKMDKGARVRLFACPKDLFLLKSESILSPLGEPMGW
jgi:hypothetical protein